MTHQLRTVVLIHGWPATTAHWRYLRPAVAEAGFAPIELTLPGLGAHPDVVAESADKRALAEAALAVVAQRGVADFSIPPCGRPTSRNTPNPERSTPVSRSTAHVRTTFG